MPLDPRRFPQQLTPIPVQIPHTPTEVERAEVEKLRGMQVRKDAAQFAAQVYERSCMANTAVLGLAAEIAQFILEG